MFKPLIASLFILAASLPVNAEITYGFGRTTSIASRMKSRAEVCTQDNKIKLSLHNGPGKQFPIVTEIANGEEVSLLGSEYSQNSWWWNISYKNRRGWVSGNYIYR